MKLWEDQIEKFLSSAKFKLNKKIALYQSFTMTPIKKYNTMFNLNQEDINQSISMNIILNI